MLYTFPLYIQELKHPFGKYLFGMKISYLLFISMASTCIQQTWGISFITISLWIFVTLKKENKLIWLPTQASTLSKPFALTMNTVFYYIYFYLGILNIWNNYKILLTIMAFKMWMRYKNNSNKETKETNLKLDHRKFFHIDSRQFLSCFSLSFIFGIYS